MYQVPVVLQLKDGLGLCHDAHMAQGHCSGKVLDVEGAQAAGIELPLQDTVFLSEVHGVDLVAVQ